MIKVSIFITGGAGFIGSHLVKFYLNQGKQVVALDDLSTGNLDNLTDSTSNRNLTFVNGSVLDEKLIKKWLEKSEICFHLAGSLGVLNIVNNPLEAFKNNLFSSEIIFGLATKFKTRTLFTSTSEIYGRNQELPLTEQSDRVLGSPQVTRWTYSEAKAIDEFLAFELHKMYSFPVTIARLFNTIGVSQSGKYGMVLPRFIKAALNDEPLVVYGDGNQSRSFCAVSDVIIALDRLVRSKETIGQVYNVGSNEEITINNLAFKVIEITNSKSSVIHKTLDQVFGDNFEETYRRVPDISKINNTINWEPKTSLEKVIIEIVRDLNADSF